MIVKLITTGLALLFAAVALTGCGSVDWSDVSREKSAEIGSQDQAVWFLGYDAARACINKAIGLDDPQAIADAAGECVGIVQRTAQ